MTFDKNNYRPIINEITFSDCRSVYIVLKLKIDDKNEL